MYSGNLMLISTSYQWLEIIIQEVSGLVWVSFLSGRNNLSSSLCHWSVLAYLINLFVSRSLPLILETSSALLQRGPQQWTFLKGGFAFWQSTLFKTVCCGLSYLCHEWHLYSGSAGTQCFSTSCLYVLLLCSLPPCGNRDSFNLVAFWLKNK